MTTLMYLVAGVIMTQFLNRRMGRVYPPGFWRARRYPSRFFTPCAMRLPVVKIIPYTRPALCLLARHSLHARGELATAAEPFSIIHIILLNIHRP
jgi:hypothetical protein